MIYCRVWALKFGHMKTLTNLNFRNTSAFTFIQEDKERPGILITFLSHAIVEIDVTDPQNLKLLAGRHDRAGYRDGSGINIRFSSPSDMVQLNRNSWIIADTDNNCLRNFNNERNSLVYNTIDTISAWSACDTNSTNSKVINTVSESRFCRPRGLAFNTRADKIYITYEEPYSLAEIHISSGRVVVLYSSSFWKLHRIIPFQAEIIISSSPKYLVFSYRDSRLGTVINKNWHTNLPPHNEALQTYASGIEVMSKNKSFVETVTNANVLALIDQEKKEISEICTGVQGHIDSQLTECQLDRPMHVVNINSTIYIGEHGWSGGGIRTIKVEGECSRSS